MINIIFIEDEKKIVRIIKAEATTQAEGAVWEAVRNVFNASFEMLYLAGRVTYEEKPRQLIEIHIADYKKTMNHITNGLYRWAAAVADMVNTVHVSRF